MSEFNEIYFSQDPIVDKNTNFPEIIAILPVRNTVAFPFSMFPLTVGRESSVKLIEEVGNSQNRLLGVITQRDPSVEEPQEVDLYTTGTLGIAAKQIRVKENNVIAVIQGVKRFRVKEFVQRQPYFKARIEILENVNVVQEESKAEAVRRSIEALFQQVISLSPTVSGDLVTIALNLENLGQLADFIASVVPSLSIPLKQELLETLDVGKRLEKLHVELTKEAGILELKSQIQSQVQDEVGKNQREYYLREQLKAIQKELGEGEEPFREIEELKNSIEGAHLPEEAQTEALRELKRLARMSPASPEYTVTKTYLDWLVSLPWNKLSEAEIDLQRARTILDRDHYGLEKIKERIVEYLAVLQHYSLACSG